MAEQIVIKQPVPPELGPNLTKELQKYQEDMSLLAEIKEKLKKLALAIKNHGNVLYEVIQVFSLYQDDEAAKIRVLADVDNVDSTLRSDLSSAQNDWNKMWNNPDDKSGNTKIAADMVKEIQQIKAFIKYEQGLGDKSIMDQASLKNLQSAIGSIEGGFPPGEFGDPGGMAAQIQAWNGLMKGGANVPAVKNIQDGFQTVNQSVSELSSTVNSQLQFTENQYKQGLGTENAAMQSYQKMNSNTIRHYTGN